MSQVHSVLWLSESLLTKLARDLQALFDGWTGAWGLPAAGKVELWCVPAGQVSPVTGDIDLLASPSAAWRAVLARAALGFQSDSPITDAVVRRMVARMQDALVDGFAPAVTDDKPSRAIIGHDGVYASVNLIGKPCGLFVSCSQLLHAGRLRRPMPTNPAPVDHERAMAQMPVPLVAEVGRTNISVTEIFSLAPGDVLVLGENLAAPSVIRSPGSDLTLLAHLGSKPDADQRAVRWVTQT